MAQPCLNSPVRSEATGSAQPQCALSDCGHASPDHAALRATTIARPCRGWCASARTAPSLRGRAALRGGAARPRLGHDEPMTEQPPSPAAHSRFPVDGYPLPVRLSDREAVVWWSPTRTALTSSPRKKRAPARVGHPEGLPGRCARPRPVPRRRGRCRDRGAGPTARGRMAARSAARPRPRRCPQPVELRRRHRRERRRAVGRRGPHRRLLPRQTHRSVGWLAPRSTRRAGAPTSRCATCVAACSPRPRSCGRG